MWQSGSDDWISLQAPGESDDPKLQRGDEKRREH
jgi:hypothetical protein